jgi:hypothetical protein
LLVLRGWRLNRASLNAPAQAERIKRGKIHKLEKPRALRWLKTSNKGATPKLTISVKESSCNPSFVSAFNLRAEKPSRLSKIKLARINNPAWKMNPWLDNIIEPRPHAMDK